MKAKSWKDKRILKLKQMLQVNKKLKGLIVLEMCLVLFLYRIQCAILHNGKKIGSIAVSWLFFMVSCSFALPGFLEVSDLDGGYLASGFDEMSASEPTTRDQQMEAILEGKEVPIIEDADILDGYEDAKVNKEDVDMYSIDDILEVERTEKEEKGTEDSAFVLNKDDWKLILVNKQHPVPDDYSFELATIKNNMKCDKRILPDLLEMLQAAKTDGVNLVICSPYRDLNRQKVLFDRNVQAYINLGLSYMEAYTVSSKAVTVPGASEHQIGLALDIICDTYTYLDDGFGETESGKWLAAHAYEYGFILRYPKGKEYITGIEYEPWHFRYVGQEAAKIITETEITLEELVEEL